MEEKTKTKRGFWELGGKPTGLDKKMHLKAHKQKRMTA